MLLHSYAAYNYTGLCNIIKIGIPILLHLIRSYAILYGKGKGTGKLHPNTGHEGQEEEQRYSSTLSLTSALYGWSTPRPGRFTPEKDPAPIV